MGKLIEIDQDLTKIQQGVILHGCNTKGVMGFGQSLALRSAFPMIYPPYRSYCQIANKMGRNILGRVIEVQIEDKDLYVLNGLTQKEYGVDGKVYADINAIERVVNHAAEFASFLKVPLYMTKIGCGFGGLKWEDVSKVVQAAADKHNIDINICNKPKSLLLDD
jgi:O-acetyl-ADP-ribose deacetylase (regulator of RNase III)